MGLWIKKEGTGRHGISRTGSFIRKKGEANVLDRALFLIEALFGAFTYLSESKLGNRSDCNRLAF